VAFSQVPVAGIDSDVMDEPVGLVGLDWSTAAVLDALDGTASDPVGASVSSAGIESGELKVTGVAAGRPSVDIPHAVTM
jgi:hypothetical protein